MLAGMRIAFVGAGNMAEAMIAGLVHGKLLQGSQMAASDIDASRLEWLKCTYGIQTTGSNRDGVTGAQVIVLAVEPQVLDEVLTDIAPVVVPNTVIISVAAGYPIARIARHLSTASRIVRAMPNTPSVIREGVTAIAFNEGLSNQDVTLARSLFAAIGTVTVVSERLMDVVTGLSGSGPAYVFVMIEALADGGVKMGLPREAALLLATQTVAGAAQLVLESREHPGVLKDRVASPGGTTIAGLYALERGCLRATVMSAVEAASRRSAELASG
jgi:pyrroline-5-carboxylate reductase